MPTSKGPPAADSGPKLPARFGRYVLDERIGAGGMAEVYRARLSSDDGFEKVVCIKRILPHLAQAPDFAAMFRDEAAIAARLQHSNIVQIFDFGEVDGSLFIAMEYVEGLSLAKLLQTVVRRGEILPIPAVLKIGVEAAKGLRHAHVATKDGKPLGIVHRDVTPHNILISRAGEVRIADFGVARADGRRTHTQTGVIKGKLQYMAPEQALGKPFDHRLDQFALGIVMHEALTGRRLFKGDSEFLILERVARADVPPPSSLRKEIPREVDAVVMRALEKDPNKRWKDMGAFENALSECLFEVAKNPRALDLVPIIERARDPKGAERPAAPTVTMKLQGPPPALEDAFDDNDGAGETARVDSSAEWVRAGDTPQMGAKSLVRTQAPKTVEATLAPVMTRGSSSSSQARMQSGPITAPTFAAHQPAASNMTKIAGAVFALVLVGGIGLAIKWRVGVHDRNRAATHASAHDGCPARYEPLGAGCFPSTTLVPNLDGIASTCGSEAVTSTSPGDKPVVVVARPKKKGTGNEARVVVERSAPGVLVLASDAATTWTVDALIGSPPSRVLLVGPDQVLTGVAPGVPVEDLGNKSAPDLPSLKAFLTKTEHVAPTSFVSCAGGTEFLVGDASRPNDDTNAAASGGERAFYVVDKGVVGGDCAGADPVVVSSSVDGMPAVMLVAEKAHGDRIVVHDTRTSPHALVVGGPTAITWQIEANAGLSAVVAIGGAKQDVRAPHAASFTDLSGSPTAFASAFDDPNLVKTWSSARTVAGGDVAVYAWCDAASELTVKDGAIAPVTSWPAASAKEIHEIKARAADDLENVQAACQQACTALGAFPKGPQARSVIEKWRDTLANCEKCKESH